MANNWQNLVSGEALKQANSFRRKEYLQKKERAVARRELELEGWEFCSTYKDDKFIKLQKEKPLGERFENRVWSVFYSMGFTMMNKDATFKISYGGEGSKSTQQIDIFAADDETVIVIECKAAEKPGTYKDFKKEIEAFEGVRGGIREEVIKQYGKARKIKFVWATSNIILGPANLTRLDELGIAYFNDDAIEYYSVLTKHLGSAAKYQLLGHLLSSEKIPNMPTTVPAIKGKMGGHTYYSFSIEPNRLLKIGYVLHRNDANKGMMPTYQRIIKPNRLKTIREFVKKGGYFPNSVIVSIDGGKKGLRFDAKFSETDSSTTLGVLYLPQLYASAYIIDGQHRLYGYSDSQYAETNTIPVVAFENLGKKEQIRLFMEINENQKAVPKNLRNTLNADMLWESESYSERRKALRSRIAQDLGEDISSPLYDRVLIGENATTDIRCITMETIEKGLKAGNFFSKFDKTNRLMNNPIFDNGHEDNKGAMEASYSFLIYSFTFFRDELIDEWNLGKEGNGLLSMNTGIYSLFRIFSDVLDCLIDNKHAHRTDSPESLFAKSKSFYEIIVEFYKKISPELRNEIKNSRGEAASTRHWRYFQKALNDDFPSFTPEGLDEWWANNSKEYNEDSRAILIAIFEEVHNQTVKVLQDIYGERWRKGGLPLAIITSHATELAKMNHPSNRNNLPEKETWDILAPEDYYQIAISDSNWSQGFKDIFSWPNPTGKGGTKKEKANWINKMAQYLRKLDTLGTSITKAEFEEIVQVAGWRCPDALSDKYLDKGSS